MKFAPIPDDEPLVVEDATHDDRFNDNPAVLGDPNVRFYAGQPLHSPDGHRIGTLCVIDREPRAFEDADREALAELADMVEAEIARSELRQVLKELHETQTTIQAQRDFMSAVLDTATSLVVVIDVHGQVLRFNRACEEMSGFTFEEVRSRPLWETVLPPERIAPAKTRVSSYRPSDFPMSYDSTWLTKDGRRRLIHWELSAILDEPGGIAYVVCTGVDVTERKRLDQMKEQFVSVVSHDLKNPPSSLSLSLSMLTDEILPLVDGEAAADAAFSLDTARKSVSRLIRLTDGLLDNERLLTGELRLQPECCSIPGLFASTLGAVEGQARQAGVTLSAEPTDLVVWGDGDRLVQVLSNLVGNAIKFSPPHTTVRLAAVHEAGETRFSVIDQGRGIPANKRDAIFERFAQVEDDDASLGGMGPGLSICRAIVKRHGGRLWVESTPGQGSTFSFTLPDEHDEPEL